MPDSIRPKRVNHINVVLEDLEASIAHFRDLYGAELLAELPPREWRACLLNIGGVIFEPFVPHSFFLNLRHGPHYLGIEYQADMEEVRAAVAAHGIRIARDIGVALHTHPADCFGVALEFYSEGFHDRDWPLLGGPMAPAAHWREAHPLGLTGLKACTVAVADFDAARGFYQSFLGGEVMYEAARPAVAGRCVGLQVADAVIEILTPVGDGPLQRHLQQFGQGIRSTVFATRDLAQAQAYFQARGVAMAPGAAPDTFAVPAEANLGLIFEFSA